VLAPQTGNRAADQLMVGRGGLPGGTMCDGDGGQPAQQRRRAEPVLRGGDVQRDGAGLRR